DGPGGAGSGGDMTGQGGEAGAASVPTLAENCASVCSDQAAPSCVPSACASDCVATGSDPTFGTDAPDQYAAMLACEAQHLTASDYVCSSGNGGPVIPIPKPNTACKTQICAWACADMTGAVDPGLLGSCTCP